MNDPLLMKSHQQNLFSFFPKFILSMLFLAEASVAPGGPYLVKDIYSAAPTRSPGSSSDIAITVGNTAYFSASDSANGAELWKSDGTPAGTRMVKDINPGPATGFAYYKTMAAMDGILYFSADDGATGWELWRTDGTPQGTFLVKDIRPGDWGEGPTNLIVLNGILFFSADDGVHGPKLWKSDGTAKGTVMVTNILPNDDLYYSISRPLADINGVTIYYYSEGSGRRGLWRSDGTAAGALMIGELPLYSQFYCSRAVNNTLYYFLNDTSNPNGYELWKTDGTKAGTTLVKDNGPDFGRSCPGWMAEMNGKLFFTISDCQEGQSDGVHGYELWKSDGTLAGTAIVKDTWPGRHPYPELAPSYPTLLNGKMYFTANDGVHGRELWKSDGTAAGTSMVREIYPGLIQSDLYIDNRSVRLLGASGNTLFLQGYDDLNGIGLWKSDGTSQGTAFLKKFQGISYFSSLNGGGFLIAEDGTHGSEPWWSDATKAGTILLKDINFVARTSEPKNFIELGGALYFTASSSRGSEIWKSNGTAAGTMPVFKDKPSTLTFGFHDRLLPLDGTIFFLTQTQGNFTVDYNFLLWKCRAEDGDTTVVKAIYHAPFKAAPPEMATSGGKLFYSAKTYFSPAELWVSDGTLAGTKSIKQFSTRISPNCLPSKFADINGTLYFVAEDDMTGVELWKTNGTPAGTVLVKDIHPGSGSSLCDNLTSVQGLLFFIACDNFHYDDRKLWRSDGSAKGTFMVKDIKNPQSLTDVKGTLYFTVSDAAGSKLWKSNGASAGTVLVKKDASGSTFTAIRHLTNVNGRLFFTAKESLHGEELWTSDGTAAGTKMVWDLYPGPSGSLPSELKSVNGKLYFSASDGVHGVELWVSDGTGFGTRRVSNIAGGPASSNPALLTKAGNTLFFSATNGAANQGRELWGLSLDGYSGARAWQAYR